MSLIIGAVALALLFILAISREYYMTNRINDLRAELEKARAEGLCPDCQTVHDQLRKRIAEVEAQRDAANRLLEECVVEFELAGARAALCARITAHLEKHGLK